MKLTSYKSDREEARKSEPILEDWYRSLPWIGYLWREPDGTKRQRMGVDVNYVGPDSDPEGPVYTIDEKVSRSERDYLTFEVMQDTDKPGWGLTATNDVIVFMTPRKRGGYQVWWIDMEGLRKEATGREVRPLDFTYQRKDGSQYVKHTLVKYVDMDSLVRTGIAVGPWLLER